MNTPTETDVKSNLKSALQELSATLTEHKNACADIEKHETIAKTNRGEIDSFARNGQLDALQQVSPYHLRDFQADLAERRVQIITEERIPPIEEKLNERNKIARKAISVALRSIKAGYLDHKTKALQSHYETIAEARVHAGRSTSVVQAEERINLFSFLQSNDYGPADLAEELVAWGNGVLTELKQVEKLQPATSAATL
jgi:hypothetical protein